MVIFAELMERHVSLGNDTYSSTGEYLLSQVDSLYAVKTVGKKCQWVWAVAYGSSLPPKHPLKNKYFLLHRVPSMVI